MHYSSNIEISSKGFSDVIDITGDVVEVLGASGITDGLLSVFVPGSTASVTTIEFEPGVVEDLKEAIERIAPAGAGYKHDARWGTATDSLTSGRPS